MTALNQTTSHVADDWPEPAEFLLSEPEVPPAVLNYAIEAERDEVLRKTFFLEYVGNSSTVIVASIFSAIAFLAWLFDASDDAGFYTLLSIAVAIVAGYAYLKNEQRSQIALDNMLCLRKMGWSYSGRSRIVRWNPDMAERGFAEPPRVQPPSISD